MILSEAACASSLGDGKTVGPNCEQTRLSLGKLRGDEIQVSSEDGSPSVALSSNGSRKGALVSRTAVSDPALIAAEGVGLIQLNERTVYASLPTARKVDTLEITATAGGETRRIDVSTVMDQFCKSAPSERACQAP
jgi:hypothetical protein